MAAAPTRTLNASPRSGYTSVGPSEASRQTGIPSGTIRSWARRAGATDGRREAAAAAVDSARLTWAQRRAEVATAAGEAAAEAVEAIRAAIGAGQHRAASNLSRAFAIAVDKA